MTWERAIGGPESDDRGYHVVANTYYGFGPCHVSREAQNWNEIRHFRDRKVQFPKPSPFRFESL